jgi:peptide/nickel transport system substrate-binding protein
MAFNAQAVAANLDRIVNPATASQKAVFMLGSYSGYQIVDEYTIRLILAEPYSSLLDSLSQVYLGMASPAAFGEYSNNRYQFHQVGTGPFAFVEYVPGDRIVLRRMQEVEFRFFIDPPTRALAIESGEAQIMGELLPLDARALTGNSGMQVLPVSVPGQPLQFLMNTQRFPTDSPAVRQALLFGANRNQIIDAVYQRFSPVAWGPLAASTLYYDRAMNGLYAHDTGQARSLLTAAGFADSNNDGYLDIGGVDLQVDVIVPPWGLIPEVAQLLQDQWRTLGVRAALHPVPTLTTLIAEVETGEYNLVAYYSFGMDPSLLNQFFLSDGATNWTGYRSLELDNILHEAGRQTDPNVRRALYSQAQQIIMQEALILPIRDYVNLNASSLSVQGLTYDSYGWFPLLNNVTLANGG